MYGCILYETVTEFKGYFDFATMLLPYLLHRDKH